MSETQQPHHYGSPCTHLWNTDGERHRHVTWVQSSTTTPITHKPALEEALGLLRRIRSDLHLRGCTCWSYRQPHELHAPSCWWVCIAEIDEMLQRAIEEDKP